MKPIAFSLTPIVLIGGPRSGERMSIASGNEIELRFQKKMPLSAYKASDGETHRTYEDRYIRKECFFDGMRSPVYIWEHDIHRNLLELFLSEMGRLKAEGV